MATSDDGRAGCPPIPRICCACFPVGSDTRRCLRAPGSTLSRGLAAPVTSRPLTLRPSALEHSLLPRHFHAPVVPSRHDHYLRHSVARWLPSCGRRQTTMCSAARCTPSWLVLTFA